MSRDVMRNTAARALLTDLADRGISLLPRRGMLAATNSDRLTDQDRAAIRLHKPALMVLALTVDDRTLARLLEVRAGRLRPGRVQRPGCCHSCGDALPRRRGLGRCGWCALASRLYAGAPIDEDILGMFDPAIAGRDVPRPTHVLAFDLAVSA